MMNQDLYPKFPVLVVDDDKNFLTSVETTLISNMITNVGRCQNSMAVLPLLENNKYSLILLDIRMPGVDGEELLPIIVEKYPEIPVIVVTGYGGTDIARECMKAGAFDYLEKPLDTEELLEIVRSAIDFPLHFSEIITRSKSMQSIFQHIGVVAKSNMPVLITGETGVGKELIANATHKISQRRGKFVPVNAAGLDDNLFSDTLFGHKKGAFTEAYQYREGMIKQAENGTLFLDEIGDLSLASQIKLLRVIDQMEYCPLGSDDPIPTNARIVVATSRDLKVIRETKKFRKDLYYRLQACEIHVPPLRDRKEDIPLLLNHFLEKELKGKKKPKVPEESFRLLSCYDFPGNVRELENLIKHVVSRHHFRTLTPDVFKEKISSVSNEKESTKVEKLDWGDPINTFDKFEAIFNEFEALYLHEVLECSKGIKTTAADLAGLNRKTFDFRWNKAQEMLKKKRKNLAEFANLLEVLKRLIE